MPRIYDSYGDPIDLCIVCWPSTEEEAEEEYRDLAFEKTEEGQRWLDDGNGGWGYDATHPAYGPELYKDDNGDWASHYRCYECGRVLCDQDDGEGGC